VFPVNDRLPVPDWLLETERFVESGDAERAFGLLDHNEVPDDHLRLAFGLARRVSQQLPYRDDVAHVVNGLDARLAERANLRRQSAQSPAPEEASGILADYLELQRSHGAGETDSAAAEEVESLPEAERRHRQALHAVAVADMTDLPSWLSAVANELDARRKREAALRRSEPPWLQEMSPSKRASYLEGRKAQKLADQDAMNRAIQAQYAASIRSIQAAALGRTVGSRQGAADREPIPERVRHEVWRRDQGRCVECGSRERLEYDHIIPASKGGSNTVRNIELRCESCNRKKGARI
jgi:hypothetical protein